MGERKVRVKHLHFDRKGYHGNPVGYACNWNAKAKKFRMTTDFKKVTCKRCLALMKKQGFKQEDFNDDESL